MEISLLLDWSCVICMRKLGLLSAKPQIPRKITSNLNSLHEAQNVMRKDSDWLKNGGLCGMDVFMSLRHVVTLEDPAILEPDGWVWSLDCEHHTSGRGAGYGDSNKTEKEQYKCLSVRLAKQSGCSGIPASSKIKKGFMIPGTFNQHYVQSFFLHKSRFHIWWFYRASWLHYIAFIFHTSAGLLV